MTETQITVWHAGDPVRIECDGQTVDGMIRLASSNSVSLMLEYEAVLASCVGMMPIMRHDDGIYRSIVDLTPVKLARR